MEPVQNDLLIACRAVIRSVIKNPPSFHNGNMAYKVPASVFKKLEDAVKIAIMIEDNNPTQQDDNQPNNKPIEDDDDYSGGFPVSFV